MKVVLFTLAEQMFAMDVKQVREVIRVTDIVPIPDVPSWIEGIIHLRGAVVPLINLHAKLHLGDCCSENNRRVIVSHSTHCCFGIIVDNVTGVLSLHDDEIQPPNDLVRQAASVAAVAYIQEQLVPILNLETILSTQDVGRLPTIDPVVTTMTETSVGQNSGEYAL